MDSYCIFDVILKWPEWMYMAGDVKIHFDFGEIE